jgi:pimeloyl-ACP methyl ester carboxylesterase
LKARGPYLFTSNLWLRDHVDAGGLVSYRANLSENFHRAATYVNKIIKGAKPGDLPLPKINVPTIVIHGADDEVNPVKRSEGHQRFFGHYERRVFEGVGHNPPQEAPERFARAILDVCN